MRAKFPEILILALISLAACSAARNVKRAPLSEEERAFRNNCAACHALPDPKAFPDEQWPDIVAKYSALINLPAAEQAKIVKFLQESN